MEKGVNHEDYTTHEKRRISSLPLQYLSWYRSVTGKKVKTTISARTKKELRNKATQAKVEFEKNGSTRKQRSHITTYSELVDFVLANLPAYHKD